MEIPQAHLAHTVGAGEDRQAHGVQSRTKMEKNTFLSHVSKFFTQLLMSAYDNTDFYERSFELHLTLLPNRREKQYMLPSG